MTVFYAAGNVAAEIPRLYEFSSFPPAFGSLAVNSATIKRAFAGPVQWVDRGTHNVRYVSWRTTVITAGTGSTFRISLQDVGAALEPDDVVDQSFTISTASLASNTFYKHQMDTDRASVAHGSRLAVVWDFSVFGSGSSIPIARVQGRGRLGESAMCLTSDGGANWSRGTADSAPVLVLEADDGTIGTIHGAVPFKAFNSHTFHSGSNPKEYAMEFVPDTGWTVVGMQPLVMPSGASSDFDSVLYGGTTALMTQSHDMTFAESTGVAADLFPSIATSSVDATAATTYRASVKPTSTNAVTVYSIDVDQANHWDLVSLGQDFAYNTLSSGGTWNTATATRRLIMQLLVTGGDTGGGGGGLAQVMGGCR